MHSLTKSIVLERIGLGALPQKNRNCTYVHLVRRARTPQQTSVAGSWRESWVVYRAGHNWVLSNFILATPLVTRH